MRNTTPSPITAGTLCLAGLAAALAAGTVLGGLQWAGAIYVHHGLYVGLSVVAIVGACGWFASILDDRARRRDGELRTELRHYAGVIEMMARDMAEADVRHHAELARLTETAASVREQCERIDKLAAVVGELTKRIVQIDKTLHSRPDQCAPDPSRGRMYVGWGRQDATVMLSGDKLGPVSPSGGQTVTVARAELEKLIIEEIGGKLDSARTEGRTEGFCEGYAQGVARRMEGGNQDGPPLSN